MNDVMSNMANNMPNMICFTWNNLKVNQIYLHELIHWALNKVSNIQVLPI
jgi:hypothetical protein